MKNYSWLLLIISGILFASCKDDNEAPAPENESEVITNVTLIFTNTANANEVVTARAEDPDGEGVKELHIMDEITLESGVTYTLTIEILNTLDPNDPEDITEEVKGEADEHQLFFSFTNNAFADPAGNGNFDNTTDPVNYNDKDKNSFPLGLSTTWTAGNTLSGGSFRVRLQHQPDIKSGSTGVDDGDTDLDLEFVLNIQ